MCLRTVRNSIFKSFDSILKSEFRNDGTELMETFCGLLNRESMMQIS